MQAGSIVLCARVTARDKVPSNRPKSNRPNRFGSEETLYDIVCIVKNVFAHSVQVYDETGV